MPEESKKNQHKGRNDAKEQRRPRQGRHQGGSNDKKHEKKPEEPKVPQKPPVYEDPGPEFYKNLKRETDDILKITEEANSKYKKKEIQSNWAKYEMPIESYEEIEEQENLGADYEKLIEAPLSVGGHFQFKHEKSWDTETGPSPYDKYFEINMESLFIAISTIPFNERIDIDKDMFNDTDTLSMNNRSTRFKQKYYNDKTFTTPELKIQDKILSSLAENISKADQIETKEEEEEQDINEVDFTQKEHNLEMNVTKINNIGEIKVCSRIEDEHETVKAIDLPTKETEPDVDPDNLNALILGDQIKEPEVLQNIVVPDIKEMQKVVTPVSSEKAEPKVETSKNPVIESPEDLEKWLDDFLDG